MNKGLSVREKTLLIFLAIFLFVFLSVYFLIIPITRWKTDIKTELETAQLNQQQTAARINSVNGLKLSVEKTREKITQNAEKIANFDEIEFLEREFTLFCQKSGLIPIRQVLLKDEDFDSGGLLVKYDLQLSAEGKVDDLLKVNDFINDKYSFRLVSVDITDDAVNPPSADYVIEAVLKLEPLPSDVTVGITGH